MDFTNCGFYLEGSFMTLSRPDKRITFSDFETRRNTKEVQNGVLTNDGRVCPGNTFNLSVREELRLGHG